MPCDIFIQEARERQLLEEAVAQLDADIAAGRKSIVIGTDGKVHVTNWSGSTAQQAGWQESCAMAHIHGKGSWLARTKMQQAGATKAKIKLTHSH